MYLARPPYAFKPQERTTGKPWWRDFHVLFGDTEALAVHTGFQAGNGVQGQGRAHPPRPTSRRWQFASWQLRIPRPVVSKLWPWTGSISSTWEFIRNASLQPHSRSAKLENLEKPRNLYGNEPSSYLMHAYAWDPLPWWTNPKKNGTGQEEERKMPKEEG